MVDMFDVSYMVKITTVDFDAMQLVEVERPNLILRISKDFKSIYSFRENLRLKNT